MRRNKPPDDGLRSLITSHLKTIKGEAVHWQPIETALTASGVPDLYGCWRGRQVWVECKRTKAWSIKMDEFQVGWQMRLARSGGTGFVAVRRRCVAGPRRLAADELYIINGESAPRLAAGGLRGNNVCGWRMIGGPESWDWDKVARILFRT